MTKVAPMPIYGKNLKKSPLEPKGWLPWNLVCNIEYSSTTKFVRMMPLGWPFNYLDPILIYISLGINCLFEIPKIFSMFPLAFVTRSLQHWWGFISLNYVVWPILFLMFSLLLKELIFLFLVAFTAAGVVQCGGHNTSPRASTIVQFIFYFDLYQSWNRLPI